jgi:2-methylisocitrate lyase-like PEP mutase family enzyme
MKRLRAYRDAGADCVFAPGVTNLATIEKLVKALDAPLNILALAAGPPIAELERVGVARVTTGSGVMRAAMGVVQRVAKEMIEEGSCQSMFAGATPYIDLKKMMLRERW